MISQEKLKDMLYNIGNKVPFIGLDVETEPKVKSGYAPIIKVSKIVGRCGAHVNEPVGQRSWGSRVANTPLVVYKDNFYLEIEVTSQKEEEFFDKGSDLPITKEEAIKRGYKEKPLLTFYQNIRDYKLSSIRAIRLNGEEYHVSKVS